MVEEQLTQDEDWQAAFEDKEVEGYTQCRVQTVLRHILSERTSPNVY